MAPVLFRQLPFSSPVATTRKLALRSRVVSRAVDPDEAEFEARVASLRKVKGALPYGETRKEVKNADGWVVNKDAAATAKPKDKVEVDYSNEVIWLETSPSKVDLAFNLVMAATLVWLPLTASAVGRCAFVKYKLTNKRIVTITDAPWKKEESMLAYSNVDKVMGVSRGFGLYGDMVIYLKEGDKLEMRSVTDWQKVRDYILERKAECEESSQGPGSQTAGKGFA